MIYHSILFIVFIAFFTFFPSLQVDPLSDGGGADHILQVQHVQKFLPNRTTYLDIVTGEIVYQRINDRELESGLLCTAQLRMSVLP